MTGLGLTLALLGATGLGAGLTLLALLLSGRSSARPAAGTERRLDRLLAVAEADRARLLNLLLAALAGQPASLQQLMATSPAQPPGPDPDLSMPAGYAAAMAFAASEYTADPNEVDGDDDLDAAALGLARH